MSFTYPETAIQRTGVGTVELHAFMKSPTMLARRVLELASQRYIGDFLLSGRYKAEGGAIMYETGESLFTSTNPEAVSPGANYPLTTLEGGDVVVAKTTKWGQDTKVTDEAIARLGIDPVERALNMLVNQSVRFIDTATLGVIASQVTQTYDATGAGNAGAWVTGSEIVEGVLEAKASVLGLGLALDPNVIVLNDLQWARAVGRLATAGVLPRESANPVVSGNWPQALGLTWVSSPHTPTTDPIILDNVQLGGMADEDLKGPGYAKVGGIGVETKAIRDDDNDSYTLRARRVTVPVVREPRAAIRVTNSGL